MVELSILIPTVSARESLLSRLLWTLQPQLRSSVEVLIHTSNSKPMGVKFDELYGVANGRLGVIVDDDDLVMPHYVDTVLRYSRDADYIGYHILYTVSGKFSAVFTSDPLRAQQEPCNTMLRHVGHKCPVEVVRAQKCSFGTGYSGDRAWASQLIATEYPLNPVVIDDILYHHDYWPAHTIGETTRGMPQQRSVGMWPYDEQQFTWVE